MDVVILVLIVLIITNMYFSELMLRNDGLLYPDIDSSDQISSGYVYHFNRLTSHWKKNKWFPYNLISVPLGQRI